jgi:hypothetical protein
MSRSKVKFGPCQYQPKPGAKKAAESAKSITEVRVTYIESSTDRRSRRGWSPEATTLPRKAKEALYDDQAKELSEDALNRVRRALEQGQSDTLKNYLRLMSRFDRYSWGNCLLVYSQRPDATHVAGFHAWLKLRRYVRKGEKGIVILAPMVERKKTDDVLVEDDRTRLFGFRAAHVFRRQPNRRKVILRTRRND